MTAATAALPRAFIWRRLHSLTGLWLVLFLIEHLLTNSQAALWLGENGGGFVRMVNALHNLPYLQAIEIFLLGVPFLVHMVWGVQYLFTSKFNSHRTDGSKPALPQYARNRAYTWQRITSWILLIAIIGHVVKFRFLEYPGTVQEGNKTAYFVRVDRDPELYPLAERLGVSLYDGNTIEKKIEISKPLSPEQIIAVAPDFGTASLLAVRNTFKNPIYVGLYTIFVLAACFHAFNGFWTFLITWGVILRMSAQRAMGRVAIALMILLACLGLISIWGTYL